MTEKNLKTLSPKRKSKLATPLALVVVLSSLCLQACNGNQASAELIQIEKKVVLIPEEIPEDLLEVPPCEELDEITWGDARSASDHYRRCSDLRGERIKILGITIRGRYDWLYREKDQVQSDNDTIEKVVREELKGLED